ncbi:MAG: TolC family protein [Gammaproteobacteria bacterium]|nr:TolC family protein [Gammaproteobacteria bacterium]
METGKAKQSDKFALETGVAIANRFLAEARGTEQVAMAGLKYLVGAKSEDTLRLADTQLKPVVMPDKTLPELQLAALKNRPEMSQVEAGLSARRALLDAKNSEFYPNIYGGLAGGFAYSPDRVSTEEVAVYDPFNKAGATPVLGVKWDLSSGAQKGKVAQAQAELDAVLELKSIALQGIPFQVAERFHTVSANDKMVKELYKAARSGRRWMISTYADFEAGIEEADKVITALQAYVLAHSEYLQVVNDYNVNVARLKVVTGEIQ